MRRLFTILMLTTTIAVGSAQTFSIQWLSFVRNNSGAPVPLRINPTSGFVDLINGIPVDSRFPSVTADGTRVVFQVGGGNAAQLWRFFPHPDDDDDGSIDEDPINGTDDDGDILIDEDPPGANSSPLRNPQNRAPLVGLHPIVSADGNHIAFASLQPYGDLNNTGNRQQIYVLDRTQNRIVPISVLWRDSDNDGVRDTYQLSLGNCIPVHVSADGRIVVFLVEWLIDDNPNAPNHPPGDPLENDHPPQNAESRLYIVDADGDGRHEPVPIPPTNQPNKWLLLVHDRDADGNGVCDEAGIGATTTRLGSYDSGGNLVSVSSVHVSANGRFIAYSTPMDPANPDERWRIIFRDWQNGTEQSINDAFVPALSDDGAYLAYLTPTQIDNDGDGQVNEDPIDGTDNDGDNQTDEDPPDFYPQTAMDLAVRRLSDGRELRLGGLQLPPQVGTADGASGWGYSDWWGAATVAVDPTNPNIAYVAFHSWATNLIDLQNVLVRDNDGDGRVDEDPIGDADRDGNPDDDNDGQVDEDLPDNFYQGVPNIFVARFNFTPNAANPLQLWQLTPGNPPQPAWGPRALPVSLEPNGANTYRLPLTASLMPTVSFVNGRQLFVAFQSLVPFVQSDTNGLWDIYLATVPLPSSP